MTFSFPNGRLLPALLVAAAAAAIALPAAARAQAQDGSTGGAEGRRVSTPGLDPAQREDRSPPHHRAAAPAAQLCGEAWYEGLERRMLVDACRRNASLSAAPQIAVRISRDVLYAEARAAARRAG